MRCGRRRAVPGADGTVWRRDEPVYARRQLDGKPGADRWHSGGRCGRHLRFRYGELDGGGEIEMFRGPNSAMYGTDAGARVMTMKTPRGTTPMPLFNYCGRCGQSA